MAENEALKALVTEAIFKSLEAGKRDELLKGAISSLLEKKRTGSWSPEKSELEQAYEQAIRQIAYEEVSRMLKEDKGIRAKINDLVLKAFDEVISNTSTHSQLVQNLAGGIAMAFKVKD